MNYFYVVVIGIAVFFLILMLIAVGVSLQKQDKNDAFPSLQSVCPDGWAGSSNGLGCKMNSLNQGTIDVYNENIDLRMGRNATNVWLKNEDVWEFLPKATVCDKRKWAISNSISWDGISNYNKCV